ncbi:MAG: winged helix-turn-helix transcriptional regulator [Anaerolineales bacterium]|nr:winged helix-turn-helix transcriptional regulator [Anaerolineales bacterium]
MAKLLRVVSEEKRLRILNLLVEKEMCVCEIMTALDASQSLVSHHLAVLRDVGLVRCRRDAQWIYYSIDSEGLAELNENYLQLLDTNQLPHKSAYGPNPTKC